MQLDVDVLELHTRHAFNIAREKAPPAWRTVRVRVRDDEGREGWGEAAASAYYGETAETVTAALERYRAVIEEAEADDAFRLHAMEERLESRLHRNASARSALSAALHDLAGKRLGVPVWKMWGLDPVAPPSSFTIGIDEIGAMREKVQEARGYPILKLKVGTDRDGEILAMIRKEHPDAVIRVDANTAWTVKEALAAIPMLADHGVEFVEQPLAPDDLDGLAALTARSPLPIVADESCETLADVAKLVGRVDGINIKLAKCGSLREALRMVACARAHGMSVMLGCMIESTLGIAAAIQLSPLIDYLDLDGAALLANDPFTGPGIGPDGAIRFNEAPGLGVEDG